MEGRPILSIITINKNNLLGLNRTLESVCGQTWTDFEYIVIDGASTDGSKEYLRENAHRMSHWISESDRGIYNAMNKGIKMAQGEYLLFLNSGDHFLESGSLEKILPYLNLYDFIFSDLKILNKEECYVKKFPRKISFRFFIKESLPHPATFIRRVLFEKIGYYDEQLQIVSDWKFFLIAICKFNRTYFKINSIISVHYLDGISANPENFQIILSEREQVLNSEFKNFMDDYSNYSRIFEKLQELRASKKIKLLIRLGLLNKF